MILAIFFSPVIPWALQSDVGQMRRCHHLKNLIFRAIGANRHLIHGTLKWENGWSKRGRERGGGVMFTATWRELALRERGMISSWADSWEHNGRLPAAAWQIEREGKSDTERLLQTASAPSSLLIISNWASGSNLGREGRQCACALSQWNAEWSLWYIFRCFEKGW